MEISNVVKGYLFLNEICFLLYIRRRISKRKPNNIIIKFSHFLSVISKKLLKSSSVIKLILAIHNHFFLISIIHINVKNNFFIVL